MKKKPQWIRKLLSFTARGIEGISAVVFWLTEAGIVLITAIVFCSVLMRYIFNYPLHWSNEITCYIFIFVVFMGQAEIMKRGQHIRVDFITGRLLTKTHTIIVDFLILCLSLFWCILIDWQAWRLVSNAYKFEITSSSLLRFPLFISYSFLFAGLALLALQLLILLSKNTVELFLMFEKRGE